MRLLELLFFAITNPIYNAWLLVLEVCTFAGHWWWWKLRLKLLLLYLPEGPYRLAMREASKVGLAQENLIYGETPCLTVKKILERISPSAKDVLLDLGCGRGLVVLTSYYCFGMSAVGIDILPSFVERGRKLVGWLADTKVEFIEADIRNLPDEMLDAATVVYLASTTFDDEQMQRIVTCLERAKAGTRLITLSEAFPSPAYRLIYSEEFYFSWGKTEVYFHEKI
ncbi:MAG: class I SAM-dependent methyltransferase [Acidobacteriota bacterium]|nr:class I SAM-dependent methyltransferase [Blastocatellia bacterium]MDW8412461.1 class I SAM-dependent methyltransferase [Acidobacteriota bacterium]